MELKEITTREGDFKGLWTRMDADKDRIFVAAYTVKDYASKGSKEIPDVYSVSVPLAATHYSKFVSKLIALKKKFQIEAEGDIDISLIVQFLLDADYSIDKLLGGKLEPSSLLTHIAHICHRGWVASQELWRVENGELITDSRSIDPRWLSWDTAGNKIKWACPLMERSAADIESEYGVKISGKTGKVRDAWDDENEYIFINDKLVDTRPNPYGYVPFVIGYAPWGPILQEKDSLEHKGEAIFYPHRDMYDEINFSASISKSMAREGLRPPLQTPGKAPASYPTSGDIVEETQPINFIPRPDMTNAQRDFSGRISSVVQLNSFPLTEFGTVTSPMSGTAIENLGISGNEVLNSRIVGLRNFLAQCARMRLDQFIQIGQTLSLGKSRQHKPSDLEGDYDVRVHLIEASIAGYAKRGSAAISLRGMMPDSWLRGELIMEDDPDSVDDEIEREEAERLVPEIKLLEQALSFADKQTDEDDIQARLLTKRLVDLIKGMGQPLQQATQPKPAQPLMRQGGTVGQVS